MNETIEIDVYARLSYKKADDGDDLARTLISVEDQATEGLERVEDDGYRVGQIFRDPAKSAWQPNVVRPQWEAMMTRLEARTSHGFWVYDLSRFTRKPIEGERLIALADRGIIVLSGDSTYNLMDPDGRKHFRDDMAAAAHWSDKTSQKSRRGKRLKARRGESNASWRAFGQPGMLPKRDDWKRGDSREYASDELIERERAALRDAAARLLAGESLRSIAFEWNAAGLLTVVGNEWTTQSLKQTLLRPSVAGLVEHRGKIIEGRVLPGTPAFNREAWDALCAFFAARRSGPEVYRYLLAGLMWCGQCGGVLMGRPMKHKKRYDDGSVNRQYWCIKAPGRYGCGRLSIDWRFADQVVADATVRRLSNPANAAHLARVAAATATERGRLQAAIRTAEETSERMAARVGEGKMTQDAFERFDDPLQVRLARLRDELAALDEGRTAVPVEGDPAQIWAQAAADGDLSMMRGMVRQAFPALTVKPQPVSAARVLSAERFDWNGAARPRSPAQDRVCHDRPGRPHSD